MGKTCEPLYVVLNVTGWVTPIDGEVARQGVARARPR